MAKTRQKPVDQLQNKWGGRTKKVAPVLSIVRPGEGRPIPAFPADLDPAYQVVWDAYWGDPVAQLVTGADHYDIGMFFMLLAHRDKLLGEALAEPVTKGSMDQDVPNPRFRVVAQLTREINKYREQLGILPLARMKLGLTREQFLATQTVRSLRDELRGESAPGGVVDLDAL